MQPLQRLPGSSSISSAVQQAALRRLQQRGGHAGVDVFELIVNSVLQQWESMVCTSFAAGMSLELNPSYVQDQVSKVLLASALSLLNVLLLTHPQLIQEFRLACGWGALQPCHQRSWAAASDTLSSRLMAGFSSCR